MAQGEAMTDLVWRGYHPGAMAPLLGVAGIVSIALLTGRWYLEEFSELTDRVGALGVYLLVLAVWPGLFVGVLYRAVTYTYRLTNRAVLIDRGPLTRPEPPVWLGDVAGVTAGASWFGRRVGVGWVRIQAASGREARLVAVQRPEEFADAIRAAVARAVAEGLTGEPEDRRNAGKDPLLGP
jgi:uncharacterized membrane protein YdbT with pleckstrin-like domain